MARRSSRANKGSGGQISQMQNIERMQTQGIPKVTPMDIVTANEPLNPLAPVAERELVSRRKANSSKGSAGDKVSTILIVAAFST